MSAPTIPSEKQTQLTQIEINRKQKEYIFPSVSTYFSEAVPMDHASMQHTWDVNGKQYLDFFGGIVTIMLKTDLAGTNRFLENTHLFALAESLGGVESLVNHPALMTHASVPKEQRKKLGITDSLVRLSVGVEDVRDLIDDLKIALEAI